jgi:hypothetical protein
MQRIAIPARENWTLKTAVMRGELTGCRNRLNQRTHLVFSSGLRMTQGHGHHDGKRQADAGLHLRLATDGMIFESVTLIDTTVDAL